MPLTPSITYWSRLEPRPRSNQISEMLSAQVRDPAWMLARQFQFGALRGEDAGSPSYVQLAVTSAPIVGWRPEGQATAALDPGVPLEAATQAEPVTPDLATRVELGQTYETLLAQASGGSAPQDVVTAFRAAYPLPDRPETVRVRLLFSTPWDFANDPLAPAGLAPQALRDEFVKQGLSLSDATSAAETQQGTEWLFIDPFDGQLYVGVKDGSDLEVHIGAIPDTEARAFLAVCSGRAIDGAALFQALKDGDIPPPITDASIAKAKRDNAQAALDAFEDWVREVFGDIGTSPAAGWRSDRLEYALEVVATVPDGKLGVLAATDGQAGDLDWHAFDLRGTQRTMAGVAAGTVSTDKRSVLPANIRFRGMPNLRFWDFEPNTTDFGDIHPDKRDLAKLIVMDFMLVHGNDWFFVPFEQAVGTVAAVDSLLVHDVFGGVTQVDRADAGATTAAGRWTMFSTTVESPGASGRPIADFFFLPSTALAAVQTGPIIEDVRFLRDEMSNLFWAIERVIENGIGRPWQGAERSDAIRAASTEGPEVARAASGVSEAVPLRYVTQTTVPDNWLPFVPVTINAPRGDIALERAVLYNDWGQQVAPIGRVVGSITRLREEEIPRSGARVIRRANRSRWTTGSTFLWTARSKAPAEGEASSALRFDLTLPTE